MVRYKCWACGKVYDRDELKEVKEYSEFWGVPAWTPYLVSPCCKEEVSEESEDLEDDNV